MGWNNTNPIQPSPDESCDASKNYEDAFFTPPSDLVEPGSFGRLIWPLRAAAVTGLSHRPVNPTPRWSRDNSRTVLALGRAHRCVVLRI